MITEHLMRPGNGSLRFTADVPASVMLQIIDWLPENGPGCHVVVTPVPVDPDAIGDAATLDAALYSGRIDARPDGRTIEFSGAGVWLDSYNDAEITRTAGTPTQWLGDLLINGLTTGTVSGGSSVTRTLPAYVATRRESLDAIAALGGWEYRIRPDFAVDAGTALFASPPTVVLANVPGGQDGALRGINGGLLDQRIDVAGIATKAAVLAGAGGGSVVATATKATTLKTPANGTPVIVDVCSSPGETTTNAATTATNFLNLQSASRQVQVTSQTPFVRLHVEPGDEVYLWDLPAGLVDTAEQVWFRGEIIAPMVVRLLSLTWPIEVGTGVLIRSNAGEWLDVTPWMEWESSPATWVVGDWSPSNYGRLSRTNPELEAQASRPWGRIASAATATETNSGVSSAFADTGITVTFTAVAGRRYRASVHCTRLSCTVATSLYAVFANAADTALYNAAAGITIPAGEAIGASWWAEFSTLAAGSQTIKIRAASTAATAIKFQSATYESRILIEDIGPV